MNRRTWLSSLLALPLVPAMFRAAKGDPFNTSGYIQTTNHTSQKISVTWTASNDCWWWCTAKDGTRVSFIASNDIGLAELEARKQLALKRKSHE